MLKQLLGKINKKKLVLTVLAVFTYVFISDFVIHGLILNGQYKETASLWRPEEEMRSFMPWMLLGQFLIAKFFCVIFARGYEGKGTAEGLRFGLLVAPFSVAPFFIQYAVTPLPQTILWSWVVLGFIQTVIGGVVAGLVYRK